MGYCFPLLVHFSFFMYTLCTPLQIILFRFSGLPLPTIWDENFIHLSLHIMIKKKEEKRDSEREREVCYSMCFPMYYIPFVVTSFWCHVVGDKPSFEMKISNPKSWASSIYKCICMCTFASQFSFISASIIYIVYITVTSTFTLASFWPKALCVGRYCYDNDREKSCKCLETVLTKWISHLFNEHRKLEIERAYERECEQKRDWEEEEI